MVKSSTQSLVITLFALSLFFAFIPEVMRVTNSAVSFVIRKPFPPENSRKSPLTNGITRDFSTLRKSLVAETINPRSRFLFVVVHLSVLFFGTLLVIIPFKKDKRE